MRLSVPVLVVCSTLLAACKPQSSPDPTKPIPWSQPPKDPKAMVVDDADDAEDAEDVEDVGEGCLPEELETEELQEAAE
jgi:hypothetical protein